MIKSKLNVFAVVFFAACVALALSSDQAHGDDFGRIVHHIEASYHVHRNHRFLMGFAGLVVKFWHVAGVKNFKAAVFEDQHLLLDEPDRRLDEIVQSAGKHGWQPIVKSYSRHNDEHSYIYARTEGKDLRLLIVSVEPNEAAVLQVKVDPEKLTRFIDENVGPGEHRHAAAMAFQ